MQVFQASLSRLVSEFQKSALSMDEAITLMRNESAKIAAETKSYDPGVNANVLRVIPDSRIKQLIQQAVEAKVPGAPKEQEIIIQATDGQRTIFSAQYSRVGRVFHGNLQNDSKWKCFNSPGRPKSLKKVAIFAMFNDSTFMNMFSFNNPKELGKRLWTQDQIMDFNSGHDRWLKELGNLNTRMLLFKKDESRPAKINNVAVAFIRVGITNDSIDWYSFDDPNVWKGEEQRWLILPRLEEA